jgi:propionyl-CoA synthetase
MTQLAREYKRWQQDKEGYWLSECDNIVWRRRPLQGYCEATGHWFSDAQVNIVDSIFREERFDDVAVLYDSAMTGERGQWSYGELGERVSRMASMLANVGGVSKGDTVIVYSPNVPETMVIMLACAKLGAVHSLVFGGFAAGELAKRIDAVQPTALVYVSCGVEPRGVVPYAPMVREALRLATYRPRSCLAFERPGLCALGDDDARVGAVDAREALADAEPMCDSVAMSGVDPLFSIYTSGTTGAPKGLVRAHAGYAVAMHQSARDTFGIDARDRWAALSDFGWIVGHSLGTYGPLLRGATTLVYEGKPNTPDTSAFFRLVERHRLSALFTAPTALRVIRQADEQLELVKRANVDMSSLRAIFVAGERGDRDTIEWAQRAFNVAIIDNYWQSETAYPLLSQARGLSMRDIKPGSASLPMIGWSLCVVDESGIDVGAPNRAGNIVAELPLPPGVANQLWPPGAEGRRLFCEKYQSRFPGYFDTGDCGYADQDGYFFIMNRSDDEINCAGHRLSTGAIEESLATHPSVAEAACWGVPDALRGDVPVAAVVLTASSSSDDVAAELVARVRADIGAVASLKKVHIVSQLPKTRSGKIIRRTLRQICVEPSNVDVPPTIENESILNQLINEMS